MKKLYISLFLLAGINIQVNAQEKTRQESKGDHYAFIYAYEKAIDAYNRAEPLSLPGQRSLADCYHHAGNEVKAESVYSELVKSPAGISPEDYYNYAMVLKTLGKNEESNLWMDKFEALQPEDLRAKSYHANHQDLPYLLKDDGKYKITCPDMNTDADDFGTSYSKDKIILVSTRSKPGFIKRKDNHGGKPYLDLYAAEFNEGKLQKPENLDKKLNGKLHDGPASFNGDGTFMAFTKNHEKDKSKDDVVELQIHFSNLADGKWSEPVPFTYNNEAYSVGHPALTADGNTMYFTSNMAGGYGGTDLYKTTRTGNGAWSKPENLGSSINTEGNEMFPFFQEDKKMLFFASDGLYGLGGLDIFMCTTTDAGTGTPKNLGSPVNTIQDDFAFHADKNLKNGYFSSNRNENDQDDIYAVEILRLPASEIIIEGIAKDDQGKPISDATITLLDDQGNAIDSTTSDVNGNYSFLTDPEPDFKLSGKKEDYLPAQTEVNPSEKESIVKADLVFVPDTKKETEPVVEPVETETTEAEIEVGVDLGKILSAKTIYFDLDKSDIRPDAALELNKIAELMNKYPSMIVELRAYTDCRDTKEYNQILSDKRAHASAVYLRKRITNPERISGKGYGKTNMVNNCDCESNTSGCNEDEHQQNRRTEFIVVKK